jgi:hypothetical protein
MVRKIISGGQTGADRAGLDFAIHAGLEHGGYVPKGRKAEDGRIDERYNLIELSTSSYPARTRKNIEESDGTVIFRLERRLSGGTKLTRELADKLGKPVLHIYHTRREQIPNPNSLRVEIQALTDFLRSKRARGLRVDAKYVALFSSSSGFWRGIQRSGQGVDRAARPVGWGREA